MGSLALNKSSLKAERDRLETFERFLPSLDLKRQQLLAEFKGAERVLLRIDLDFVDDCTIEIPRLVAVAVAVEHALDEHAVRIGHGVD